MNTRKVCLFLISVLTLLVICKDNVCAESIVSGDYEYEVLINGKAKIVDYMGEYQDELYIPDTIDGYSVSAIGKKEGDYCAYIEWNAKKIYIPDGVTLIEDADFLSYNVLTDIYIPASVTVISNLRCSSLKNIHVDKNNRKYCDKDGVLYSKDMTIIYKYPENKSGGKYSIDDNAKIIEKKAFISCDNLKSIDIPENVEEICEDAFRDCSKLLEITIPRSVGSIGNYAFSYCSKLTNVYVENGLEEIGYDAFRECKDLSSFTIPESVIKVQDYVFSGCDSLEAIAVDSGNRKYCSKDGVLYTKNMKELCGYPEGKKDVDYIIPEGVETLHSFGGARLQRLVIPQSLAQLNGSNVFVDCTRLQYIDVNDGNQFFYDIDGVLFSYQYDTLLCYPPEKNQEEYAIPQGVRIIGSYAIHSSVLKKLIIPTSVRELRESSINCGNLKNCIIPGSVSEIYSNAIYRYYLNPGFYVEKDSPMEEYFKNEGYYDYSIMSKEDMDKISRQGPVLIRDYSFPDEKFRNIISSFDADSDGCLTKNERDDITEIKTSRKDLTDLSGIEYFCNLKILDCRNNDIKELDLRGNKLLEKLFCYNNNISNIKLSNDSKLSLLYCWNNAFDNLDVSTLSYDGLLYNFSKETETTQYPGIYTDYNSWGGTIDYNIDSKELVFINPKPYEYLSNYSTEPLWVKDYTGQEMDLSDCCMYYNKDQIDQRVITYGTNFSCIGYAKYLQSNDEDYAHLDYIKGVPKTPGCYILKLEGINVHGTNYVKGLINEQPPFGSNENGKNESAQSENTYKNTKQEPAEQDASKDNLINDTNEVGGKSSSKNSKKTLARVSFKKVKALKRSRIYFSWKKVSGASGYQYNISKMKSFKKVRTYTTKATYKKLEPDNNKKKYDVSGCRFYIRVRAYAKVGKKTYYGKWSETKTIKVK